MDKPVLYPPEQIETVLREAARCAVASAQACFSNVANSLCTPNFDLGCIHKDVSNILLLSELAGEFELERLCDVLFWHYGKYADRLEQMYEQKEEHD